MNNLSKMDYKYQPHALSIQHEKVYKALRFLQILIHTTILCMSGVSAILVYIESKNADIISSTLNILTVVLVVVEYVSGLEKRKASHQQISYAFNLVHKHSNGAGYPLVNNNLINMAELIKQLENESPKIPSFFKN